MNSCHSIVALAVLLCVVGCNGPITKENSVLASTDHPTNYVSLQLVSCSITSNANAITIRAILTNRTKSHIRCLVRPGVVDGAVFRSNANEIVLRKVTGPTMIDPARSEQPGEIVKANGTLLLNQTLVFGKDSHYAFHSWITDNMDYRKPLIRRGLGQKLKTDPPSGQYQIRVSVLVGIWPTLSNTKIEAMIDGEVQSNGIYSELIFTEQVNPTRQP